MKTGSPSLSNSPNTAGKFFKAALSASGSTLRSTTTTTITSPPPSSSSSSSSSSSTSASTMTSPILRHPEQHSHGTFSMIQQASQRAQREMISDYQHHIEHVNHYHEHHKAALPDVFHIHGTNHDQHANGDHHPHDHGQPSHHLPSYAAPTVSSNGKHLLSSPERKHHTIASSVEPSLPTKSNQPNQHSSHPHHPSTEPVLSSSTITTYSDSHSVSPAALIPNLSAAARKLNQAKGIIARKHHRRTTYCNREGYLSFRSLCYFWGSILIIVWGIPLVMDNLHSGIDSLGLYSGLRTVSVFSINNNNNYNNIQNNTVTVTNTAVVSSPSTPTDNDTVTTSTATASINDENGTAPSVTNTSSGPWKSYDTIHRYLRRYRDTCIIFVMKMEAFLHILYMRNIYPLLQSFKRNIVTDLRNFLFNVTIKNNSFSFSTSSVVMVLNIFTVLLILYRTNLSSLSTIGGQVTPYLLISSKVATVWVTSLVYLVTTICLTPFVKMNENIFVRYGSRITVILIIVTIYSILYTVYSLLIDYASKKPKVFPSSSSASIPSLPFTVRTLSGWGQFVYISSVLALGLSVFTLLILSLVQSLTIVTAGIASTVPDNTYLVFVVTTVGTLIPSILTASSFPIVYSIFCYFLLSTMHTRNTLGNFFTPVLSAALISLVVSDVEYPLIEDYETIHQRFPLRDTLQTLWKHLDASPVAALQSYRKTETTTVSNENSSSTASAGKTKITVHPFPELNSWALNQASSLSRTTDPSFPSSTSTSSSSPVHVSVLSQLARACLLSLSDEDQFRYLYDLPVHSLATLPIVPLPSWLHTYVDIHSSTPLAASTPLPYILYHTYFWTILGITVSILNYYNQHLYSGIGLFVLLATVYCVLPFYPLSSSSSAESPSPSSSAARIEGYHALAYITQSLGKLGKLTDEHLYEAIIESLQLTKDMEYVYSKEDTNRTSKVWPPNHSKPSSTSDQDSSTPSCFCQVPEIPLAPVTSYRHQLRYKNHHSAGKSFLGPNENPEALLPLLLHLQNQTLHDDTGSTKLHFACLQGLPDGVRLLIEETNMDMDILDREGNTPLHIALANKHGECANILISKGCNIHIRNIHGIAPLHLAIEHGLTHTAALLLRKGASVNKESISMNAHGIDDAFLPTAATPAEKKNLRSDHHQSSTTTPATNGHKRVSYTNTNDGNVNEMNGSSGSDVVDEDSLSRIRIFGPKPELGSSIARSTLPTSLVNTLLKRPTANPPASHSSNKPTNKLNSNLPSMNAYTNPSSAASLARAALIDFAYDN